MAKKKKFTIKGKPRNEMQNRDKEYLDLDQSQDKDLQDAKKEIEKREKERKKKKKGDDLASKEKIRKGKNYAAFLYAKMYDPKSQVNPRVKRKNKKSVKREGEK